MRKFRNPKWDTAKKMPPLKHSFPGEKFDIRKSEAAQWLASQPEIMLLIFDAVKSSGRIVYDPVAGTWRGVEWDD